MHALQSSHSLDNLKKFSTFFGNWQEGWQMQVFVKETSAKTIYIIQVKGGFIHADKVEYQYFE